MQKRTQAVMRITAAMLLMLSPSLVLAQHDTGVRGGAPGPGGPASGIQIKQLALFREGIIRTTQLEAVGVTCAAFTTGGAAPESAFPSLRQTTTALGPPSTGHQC